MLDTIGITSFLIGISAKTFLVTVCVENKHKNVYPPCLLLKYPKHIPLIVRDIIVFVGAFYSFFLSVGQKFYPIMSPKLYGSSREDSPGDDSYRTGLLLNPSPT